MLLQILQQLNVTAAVVQSAKSGLCPTDDGVRKNLFVSDTGIRFG